MPNALFLQRTCRCCKEKVLRVSGWDIGAMRVTECWEVGFHHVPLQCTCQILCSFSTDCVGSKVKFSECLYEMSIAEKWWNAGVQSHCVYFQCKCEMLCSFATNLVECKIKDHECLCKIKMAEEWSEVKESNLTVFTCNALAKYFAPGAQIAFHARLSVVSACVEWRW